MDSEVPSPMEVCEPEDWMQTYIQRASAGELNEPPSHTSRTGQDWKYEMRREAQQIIPNLYLGPFQSSTSRERLDAMGVTHVLCVRDRKEASLIYPRFPIQYKYLTLDISDNSDQNVITIFPQCKAFIENAIAQGGTVLAHCNGGIATSPAIVVGYLMHKFGWTYERTLSFVQSKRYCVSPSSFSIQLREYEPIVIAQKMMEQAGSDDGRLRENKRGMEDDDGEAEYKRQALFQD